MVKKLTKRRRGYIQEVSIGGVKLFLHTGEYQDGSLAEIFLTLAKQGSTLRGMADSFAIAFSLALQNGTPLEKLIDVYRYTKYPPEGIVTDHKYIRMASSLADLVVRDLGINYLGRMDLASMGAGNITPESTEQTNEDGEEKHNEDAPLHEKVADMTSGGKF